MAINLSEDDTKALNHYVDSLLQAFKSDRIDQYKARADLEHVITAAARDDIDVLNFLRNEPSELQQPNGDSQQTDQNLWPAD